MGVEGQGFILFAHARQLLDGFIGIIHRMVFDELRQVIGQCCSFHLYDRSFAFYHHIGEGMDDAVHSQGIISVSLCPAGKTNGQASA
ncbi:hypothetical protein DW830_10585 [Prevotella sp. AM34-19LB]|nr:hypothetical protein DW830_10585 [Prevotella sp. AM34-19LB]